jgi:hypothetical protein
MPRVAYDQHAGATTGGNSTVTLRKRYARLSDAKVHQMRLTWIERKCKEPKTFSYWCLGQLFGVHEGTARDIVKYETRRPK